MTAPAFNIIGAPGAPELAGVGSPPGVPADANRVATGQPGNSSSFAGAMQVVENSHGDARSGSVLPPDHAVSEVDPAGLASTLNLALPASPNDLLIGEQGVVGEFTGALPGEEEGLELPVGNSLPEFGPPEGGERSLEINPQTGLETGDAFAPVVGQPEALSLVSNGHSTIPTTASTIALQHPAPNQLQANLASVTPRSPLLDGQVNPDANSADLASTLPGADEPATLTQQTNQLLESNLRISGRAQDNFAAQLMQTGPDIRGRAGVVTDLAAMMTDSGAAGFAHSTPQASMGTDQLLELQQFQNMRLLQPTVDPQKFAEGLGQRLMVMAGQGVQSARMKLYPENLGTLDIRIQVEDDTARVWFTAQPGQARDALEAALPKLKDLFAQQGMELVEADVGSESERRDANDALDRLDDVFLRSGGVESEFTGESMVLPNVAYVSARALDIYV